MSSQESEKITNTYKAERNRLLGYIRNRIPDRIEAEDILQDVFYQLTVGFLFLVVLGVQALWNWLIPVLFNGPVISFWQTVGLFFLSKILLTGIAPHSHNNYYKKDWRRKFHSKFKNIKNGNHNISTPEQG